MSRLDIGHYSGRHATTERVPVRSLTWHGIFQGCDDYVGFSFTAHRVVWALHHQREPGDLVIRHRCDKPGCCNQLHLLDGTLTWTTGSTR